MPIYSYGRIPDLEDVRDYPFNASLEILKALPPSMDLRSEISFSPYDQGPLGSCVSNAAVAIMRILKYSDILSRLFIYYVGRRLKNADTGESVRQGVKTLATIGACQESEWPYIIDQFAVQPPTQCYVDAKLNVAIQYQRIMQNLTQMQACLATGFPFLVGFTVYESFESTEVATYGVVPMPQWGESVLGGHCCLVCGYDNATQRFLCLNSWGSSWGMQGFFRIPYLYILNSQLASDFWTIRAVS